MKILYGQLTETRYEFPDKATSSENHGNMTMISEKVHVENQVAYMNDDLGVHKMWNDGTDYAVSLHLYTPPNIVRDGCFVFDESTGERTHVKTFENFSFRGKRVIAAAGSAPKCG
jgi:cysteine dioxygenase